MPFLMEHREPMKALLSSCGLAGNQGSSVWSLDDETLSLRSHAPEWLVIPLQPLFPNPLRPPVCGFVGLCGMNGKASKGTPEALVATIGCDLMDLLIELVIHQVQLSLVHYLNRDMHL